MGAKFPGKWQDTQPTFIVYDTTANTPEAFMIDPATKKIESFVARA